MSDRKQRSGPPHEKAGTDEVLPCRVGRKKGRVVLSHDKLYVESDDEGFETKSFLLDESLQLQEKFGRETVSVELQQEDEWVRAWKISREDYKRIQERVRMGRDLPLPGEEEEVDSPCSAGAPRHEPVAAVAANLWQEITGSPGRAHRRSPQVTVHVGPNDEGSPTDPSPRSGQGKAMLPGRFDPLGVTLALGLFLFVLHTLWVGLAPHGDDEMRRALRGDEKAVRSLAVRLAREDDLAARVAIVETLSLSGGPEVRSALVQGLLQRSEPYYRRVTVQALTRLRVGNEIVGALSGKEPIERRRRLLRDLGEYGSVQVIPSLQAAYASSDVEEALKGEVAAALARLGETAPLVERLSRIDPVASGEALRLALSLEEPRLRVLLGEVPRPLPVPSVEAQIAEWFRRHPSSPSRN